MNTFAAFNPENVPLDLRERHQWVTWGYVLRHGRRTKCPYNARTGAPASSTDQKTWSTFDEAFKAWGSDFRYAGVGYVFSKDDPFTGIDLDGCVNTSGEYAENAYALINKLNSYTETSPSGRGVKIFIKGRKPEWARCKSRAMLGYDATEVYSDARFFTVTSLHDKESPRTIEERQEELEALCRFLWPQEASTPEKPRLLTKFFDDDESLLKDAVTAANGDKFKMLWEGDTSLHGGDHSAADLALCRMLAFWAGNDMDRMDRLFRRSGLYRKKWDEQRGAKTYGQITIAKAARPSVKAHVAATVSSRSTDSASPDPPMGPPRSDLQMLLGQRDPASGKLVLAPQHTLPTAEAYLREFNQCSGGQTLFHLGGQFLEWRDNRVIVIEEGSLHKRLQRWLHDALWARYNVHKKAMELVAYPSNPKTVRDALTSIEQRVHLPASTPSPSWLRVREGRPPASEILPCKTMNLHVPSGLVLPPTPELFTFNALDFDFDAQAQSPVRWSKFLLELFGDDADSVALLQEWFGYCLISDTSQQKMLLLVGPRRSGKGTIARILTHLVGANNVVGPTTGSLAGPFGLQPLMGKSLAIVSDARFRGENISTVVERQLCVSGEDAISIDRKYLEAVTMKLGTRFMFLTNELPRLSDAGSALPGRFLVLQLSNSFYGSEDTTLSEALLVELSGILLWAIEGWRRLRSRGRFLQPKSSENAIADLEALASPVGAFVRDCCTVRPGERVPCDDLYKAWQAWCTRDGRENVSNKQVFGRDLKAAVPGIQRRRGTGLAPFYEGIGLAEGL